MRNAALVILILALVAMSFGCSTNQIATAVPSVPDSTAVVISSMPSPSLLPIESLQTVDTTAAPAETTATATATATEQPTSSLTPAPTTVIVFKDKELERLIKKVLGKKGKSVIQADLDGIATVGITGPYIVIRTTKGEVIGDKVTSITRFNIEYEVNGKWSKEPGKLKTLDDFVQFSNLSILSIWYQSSLDIDALPQMKKLSILALSNDNIKDISVLAKMTQLQNLDLTNNPITDYSPLDELKNTKMNRDSWTMK